MAFSIKGRSLVCSRRRMLASCVSLGVSFGAALTQASCSSPNPREKRCVSEDGEESVLVDLDTPCPPGTDVDVS